MENNPHSSNGQPGKGQEHTLKPDETAAYQLPGPSDTSPSQYPYMPTEYGQYIPPVYPGMQWSKQKKKRTALAVILICTAAALAAALAAVFLWVLMTAISPAVTVGRPEPILYEKDGNVFLANGDSTVGIDDVYFIDADYGKYINGLYSYDNRYFFYMANVDKKTGAGDLMRVSADARGKPQKAADGVCTAKVSGDGAKVLFVSDVHNGFGKLYACIPGEEPLPVSGSVMPEWWTFGFSPNGEYIFYITKSPDGCYTLYVKAFSGKAAKIKESDIPLTYAVVDNGGRLLFELYDESSCEYTLYLYTKDGGINKVGTDAYIELMFGSCDDLLYASGTALYYRAPGEDKQRLSRQYCDIALAPYFGSDPSFVPEKRFLLAEFETDIYSKRVTLYEQEAGKDKIKITRADSFSYQVDPWFTWVAFDRGKTSYLVHKENGKWGEPKEISKGRICSNFDLSGQYYYYIEPQNEESYTGDLYRYSLRTGENELLMYDIADYYLTNHAVFARTTEDELYHVDSKDDKKKLMDNIDTVYSTNGGLMAVTYTEAYDIFFLPAKTGDAKAVCHDANGLLYVNYFIEYTDTSKADYDIETALFELYQDAQYYLDIVSGTFAMPSYVPYRDWMQCIVFAESFIGKAGLLADTAKMFSDFYYGYQNFDYWYYEELGSAMEAYYGRLAIDYFTNAIEAYKWYAVH
ncbi:MAG: hypothetical protein ACOX8Q_07905 [Christensenellales bacterium]|jgi:hypothetical protein